MGQDAQVLAAGGVIWRRRPDAELELALVHRPKYDDWSLPKGKLDPGESFEQAALREVVEETGMCCALGTELPSTRYRDARARPKLVRYWLMTVRSGAFEPGREVDELRWLAPARAVELLSYAHDAEIVRAAATALDGSASADERSR